MEIKWIILIINALNVCIQIAILIDLCLINKMLDSKLEKEKGE